jgi:hypothetical protein
MKSHAAEAMLTHAADLARQGIEPDLYKALLLVAANCEDIMVDAPEPPVVEYHDPGPVEALEKEVRRLKRIIEAKNTAMAHLQRELEDLRSMLDARGF